MKLFFQKYLSFIAVIVVLIIPIFAMLPLFHPGFFPIHDDEQVGRLVEMHKTLMDGQIPPRWVPDLGFGYGYPLYNFYPPLFYYTGVIFSLLGVGFIFSTKIALIIGFVLSSLFMYLWVKNRWGRLSGIFAAVVYTYLPYHAVDIYVRGAFPEFFSFIFVPAIFWAMDHLGRSKEKKWIVILGLSLAGLVLSHNLVALQAILFILLYSAYLLFENKKDAPRIITSLVISAAIALGLSAYFWLPSLAEKSFTLVDTILIKELANYTIHFVYPIQLWSSPWGYGGSAAGLNDGLSFQIGKLHILVAFLAFAIVAMKKTSQRFYAMFILGLFIIGIFMTTQFSKFIWDHVSPLWYVQFPWRFLLFVGVFASALAGFVFAESTKLFILRYRILLLLGLVVLFMYQVHREMVPQRYMNVDDDHYIFNISYEVSRMSYEYVPKEVATRKSVVGTTELAIDKNHIASKSYSVISGHMGVREIEDLSQEKKYLVKVDKSGVLQINTYSFPGWEVIVDGKKVSYNDTNTLHLIQIPLTSGNHMVDGVFTNTKVRTIGNIVSVLTAVMVIFSSIYIWKKRK